MKSVVTYLRVSTAGQGKSGLGLDAQRERVAEFIEIESGAEDLSGRPELRRALAAAKQFNCPIAVAKLDRLSRDVHFISGLMTHKVPFIVADLGLNADPFMLHLYAALAEKERQLISSRTRDALARSAKTLGGDRGQLEKAREASARVRTAAALENDKRVLPIIIGLKMQGKTLREIAGELNRMEIKTPREKTWAPGSISAILRRQP